MIHICSIEKRQPLQSTQHQKSTNGKRDTMKTAIKKTPSASKTKWRLPQPAAEGPAKPHKHLRRCDYEGILKTFENEIACIDQRPSRQEPGGSEWLYAAAAQAALVCGDRAKARRYYSRLTAIVKKMRLRATHGGELRWHLGTLKQLESELLPFSTPAETLNHPTEISHFN